MTRVAVLTGATRGLGRCIAERLAQRAYRLVLIDRDPPDEPPQGAGCVFIRGDLAEESTFARVSASLAEIGRVDLLVNNAGVFYSGAFETSTVSQIQRVFEVNALAPIRMCHVVYPIMLAAKHGHIINVLSTTARRPKRHEALYAGTKAAVAGFSEAFAIEAKQHGIRVTSVFPGGMRTSLYDGLATPPSTEAFMDPGHVADVILATCDAPITPGEIVISA